MLASITISLLHFTRAQPQAWTTDSICQVHYGHQLPTSVGRRDVHSVECTVLKVKNLIEFRCNVRSAYPQDGWKTLQCPQSQTAALTTGPFGPVGYCKDERADPTVLLSTHPFLYSLMLRNMLTDFDPFILNEAINLIIRDLPPANPSRTSTGACREIFLPVAADTSDGVAAERRVTIVESRDIRPHQDESNAFEFDCWVGGTRLNFTPMVLLCPEGTHPVFQNPHSATCEDNVETRIPDDRTDHLDNHKRQRMQMISAPMEWVTVTVSQGSHSYAESHE